MVSLRRRRLLGLSSGKSSYSPVIENQMHSAHLELPTGNHFVEVSTESSIGSSSSEEQDDQQFSASHAEEKLLRVYRRRPRKDCSQSTSALRKVKGVYLKKRKWEAAIKVDHKTIHLGTFRSQEKAAHSYDRAAFMCGRKPNFELSEEEKEELRQLNWVQFMEMTRREIANKSEGSGSGSHKRSEPPSENAMRIVNNDAKP